SNGAAFGQSQAAGFFVGANGINTRSQPRPAALELLLLSREAERDRSLLGSRANGSETLHSPTVSPGARIQGSHVPRHYVRGWLLRAVGIQVRRLQRFIFYDRPVCPARRASSDFEADRRSPADSVFPFGKQR